MYTLKNHIKAAYTSISYTKEGKLLYIDQSWKNALESKNQMKIGNLTSIGKLAAPWLVMRHIQEFITNITTQGPLVMKNGQL